MYIKAHVDRLIPKSRPNLELSIILLNKPFTAFTMQLSSLAKLLLAAASVAMALSSTDEDYLMGDDLFSTSEWTDCSGSQACSSSSTFQYHCTRALAILEARTVYSADNDAPLACYGDCGIFFRGSTDSGGKACRAEGIDLVWAHGEIRERCDGCGRSSGPFGGDCLTSIDHVDSCENP
jgi:hypothetical protein